MQRRHFLASIAASSVVPGMSFAQDTSRPLRIVVPFPAGGSTDMVDRKSTRLNSSHANISYAVFCLKKKKHTFELQSRQYLVCRLLLEKKKEQTAKCAKPSSGTLSFSFDGVCPQHTYHRVRAADLH